MSDRPGRLTLASVLGVVSVVASLGFVAWEIKQNTVATRAATYDRLAEASSAYYWELARDAELAALFRRVFAGEPLENFEPAEQTRVQAVILAHLTHLENSYRQYTAGVVGEDIFSGYGWRDGLLRAPAFRLGWDQSGLDEGFPVLFNPEFSVRLSSHLEGIPMDDVDTEG